VGDLEDEDEKEEEGEVAVPEWGKHTFVMAQ
jgi:hypothetical protein